MMQIGKNIIAKIDGDTLTLTINLKADLGESKSGKTRMVATTSGNAALPDGSKLGLNLFRSK